MPRADAFHAFYRESRSRLLVQVYAYTGDTEVAQRALADAYVSAGHHWRKLAAEPDRDAWIRDRAFKATGRVQNRARKPWYVRARRIADEHRPLLHALQSLEPTDRRLVILAYLAGLDLQAAGREVGMTDEAAAASLRTSANAFAAQGVDSSPDGLAAAMRGLRLDTIDEPVDRASRLRREGNRRRRTNVVLVGLMSLALLIGAGALTAAKTPTDSITADDPGSPGPAPTPPASESPTTPPPRVDTSLLAQASHVARMQTERRWRHTDTSTDFGTSTPYDACVRAVPSDKRAAHFWVRTFEAGRGPSAIVARQALELSKTSYRADQNFRRLVTAFSSCAADNHQIVKYAVMRGVGDAGAIITMRYVDGTGIHSKQVAVAQSGKAVVVWVVESPSAPPVIQDADLVVVTGKSMARLCVVAVGSCGRRPFGSVGASPPSIDRAKGFLTALDLPVFTGLTDPWAATSPNAARINPAATDCDQANFAGAGATDLRARSFVVPEARRLATFFGMTQALGRFPSVPAAERFLNQVDESVSGCSDRQASLEVNSNQPISVPQGRGRTYVFTLALSEDRTLTFRVALFRVGTSVAQLTFTPTQRFDVSPAEFDALVQRAALRLAQG